MFQKILFIHLLILSFFICDYMSATEQAEQDSSLAVSQVDFLANLKSHVLYNSHAPNAVGHILISGQSGISQSTWLYVKKALEYYRETKPAFIILELNTPGGELFPAQQIADALTTFDTQMGIPILAYINNWAISAGAMLAYSSRYIVTVKDGSMGAAEPVIASQESGGMISASEKVNSAIRADFANRARFFDRNPEIAKAMVDKDVILVKRDGKIISLDNDSQIVTTGEHPDTIINRKGKLLTLTAQQMIDYGVADLMLLPQKTEFITAQEEATGKWPANKMILFNSSFFNQMPDVTIDSYKMDWKTQLFVWLATPWVSSLLFLGLLLGGYLEFSAPGFGVPGSIAVICLILIVLSSLSLEIANWLEVILIVIGLSLLLIELFIVPTAGLLGIFGFLCFMGGLIAMMIPDLGNASFTLDNGELSIAGEMILKRIAWLCATFVLACFLMAVLAKYINFQSSAFSRFILQGHEQDSSQGYIASDNMSDFPKIGTVGVVKATLRPSGKVEVEGRLFEAISSGDFIDQGSNVTVTGVEGNLLAVRLTNTNEEQKSL